jgi:hypothetical protein
LKSAVSAVKSGNFFAVSSMIHRISCRIFHDWISRVNSPPKKLGRNAVLSADFEIQLHQKIIRLQQAGFGLTHAILNPSVVTPTDDSLVKPYCHVFRGYDYRRVG